MRTAKWIVGIVAAGMLGNPGILHPLIGVGIGAAWVWLMIHYPRPEKVLVHADQRIVVHRPQRRRYFHGTFRPYRRVARYGAYRAVRGLFR